MVFDEGSSEKLSDKTSGVVQSISHKEKQNKAPIRKKKGETNYDIRQIYHQGAGGRAGSTQHRATSRKSGHRAHTPTPRSARKGQRYCELYLPEARNQHRTDGNARAGGDCPPAESAGRTTLFLEYSKPSACPHAGHRSGVGRRICVHRAAADSLARGRQHRRTHLEGCRLLARRTSQGHRRPAPRTEGAVGLGRRELPSPRQICQESRARCTVGQARPRHRSRRGDSSRAADSLAAHEKQPHLDWRTWHRKDRHRRRTRPTNRPRRCARELKRQTTLLARHGGAGRRCQVQG